MSHICFTVKLMKLFFLFVGIGCAPVIPVFLSLKGEQSSSIVFLSQIVSALCKTQICSSAVAINLLTAEDFPFRSFSMINFTIGHCFWYFFIRGIVLSVQPLAITMISEIATVFRRCCFNDCNKFSILASSLYAGIPILTLIFWIGFFVDFTCFCPFNCSATCLF